MSPENGKKWTWLCISVNKYKHQKCTKQINTISHSQIIVIAPLGKIIYIAHEDESSFILWPFIRLELIVDVGNEDDTSAFDRAVVAVEPNVADDGDNDGTVDIEDPGEAELELVLRCR